MKELIVISGKGGTGKTSILASFAALASSKVLADCDVDAADLHLILAPTPESTHEFWSGNEAQIRQDDCTRCGDCFELCRFESINTIPDEQGLRYEVDPTACEGCGVCFDRCPANAIDFPESLCGEWYLSQTRYGSMVHAHLGIAAENSGKLVSLVRQQAKERAVKEGKDLVLVDGPPGIGCPVIASITGASLVLIVTEPTLSGAHDLKRVVELTQHFRIPAAVCVNKWDLNEAMCVSIEESARAMGVTPVGRIRYDAAVTAAQVAGKSLPEFNGKSASADVAALWERVNQLLEQIGD